MKASRTASKLLNVLSVAMTSPYKFNVVSTFSGCGGSSLGYHLAGGNILLAVEWDDNAVQTYRANFPDTQVWHGDIHDLSVEEILRLTGLKPGELDLFDGSPPCQGFSMAKGSRNYFDSRNQLYHEYVRILRGLRPKTFIMENVSGMVKGPMKLIFADILRELKSSGYKVKARLMNAKYYGVPQSRERMIFVGVREDLELEPSHPNPQETPVTASAALQGVPAEPYEYITRPDFLKLWQDTKPGDLFATAYERANNGKRRYFNSIKLDPAKPSPTIVKTVMPCTGSGLYHWDAPRILTISEIKRLATFPDDFQFFGRFEDKWARIGNCVPPNFMKAIASHVYENIISKANGREQ